MGDKEQDNYLRNLVVIANYGKEALVCLLEKEISSKNMSLENFVNSNQHAIYHLCFNKKKCCQCVHRWRAFVPTSRVLSESQLGIILDRNIPRLLCHNTQNVSDFCCCRAHSNLTTERFDVTFLRCFLTNFGTLWKVTPIEQAVNTVLRYRNDYGHASETRISESLFQHHKADIENAILDIFSNCKPTDVFSMKQRISELYNRSLDPCSKHLRLILEDFRLQSSKELQEIQEVKDHIEHVEQFDSRQHNIIAWTEAFIKKHRDDPTYIETAAVRESVQILNNNNILILVSKAGGGKSKLCLELARIYKEKHYKPMIFTNTKKIKTDLISSNFFVILEDIFGGTNLEFDDDVHKSALDFLIECPENGTKFVITMRTNGEAYTHIFSQHEIFKNNIVNLDQFLLSKSVRTKIFVRHLTVNNISICKCDCTPERECCNKVIGLDGNIQVGRTLFEEIVTRVPDTHVGFPQACHVFCSNIQMARLGLKCFENTTKSQIDKFKGMKLKALTDHAVMYQYCILVYTAIKGYFDLKNLDNILISNILSALKSDANIITSDINQILTALQGRFLVQEWLQKDFMDSTDIPVYFFQHTTILEAVLISYGDNFLKNMSFSEQEYMIDKSPAQLKAIIEYVRPEEYQLLPIEHEFTISVGIDLLVQGLVEFLKSDRNAIEIGKYLRKVGLKSRNDKLITNFFKRAKSNRFRGFTIERLIDGLTKRGKCLLFSTYNREILEENLNDTSFDVFFENFCPAKSHQFGDNLISLGHKALLKKLSTYMVSINGLVDHKIGYRIGKYLRKTSILKRNDAFVKLYFRELDLTISFLETAPTCFLDQIINEKSEENLQYLQIKRKHTFISQIHSLLDGLTDCCKCSLFMEYHPTICEKYGLFGSIEFILAVVKIKLKSKSMDKDIISDILFSRINTCDYYYIQQVTGNCLRDEIKTSNREYSLQYHCDTNSIKVGQFLRQVRQHTSNKFVNFFLSSICFVVNEKFKSICCAKLPINQEFSYKYLSPLTMKCLLETLDNSFSISSSEGLPLYYKAFFGKFVFVYSSIPTFLKYCRPISSDERNKTTFVEVESALLAMKLTTGLREFSEFHSETEVRKYFGLSGNDAIVLETDHFMYYLDSNYFDQTVIRDIGSYVYNHGILKGNVNFIDSVIQCLECHVDNGITNIITNEDVLITLPKPPNFTSTRLELFNSGLTNDGERLDEVKRFAPKLFEQVRRAQASCDSKKK